jgi:ribose-phosphate pyrophosphokinase
MIISSQEHKKFNFPAGEMHVQLLPPFDTIVDAEFVFTKNEDIIELLLFANALKEHHQTLGRLKIPYVPFGRQDRVASVGECFSLRVFADLINSLNAFEVIVIDPHSDVIPALIKNCTVIHQHEIFDPLLNTHFDNDNYLLICPDGGALKKIYKLLPGLAMCDGVIECSKLRNVKTGEITGTRVHTTDHQRLYGSTCVIVDDICDGGRTFIEIAKVLKTQFAVKRVALCVTHGFFTKGLDVFEGLIDDIFTRSGRIK